MLLISISYRLLSKRFFISLSKLYRSNTHETFPFDVTAAVVVAVTMRLSYILALLGERSVLCSGDNDP
jgi:hypothetical protein